MLKTLSSHSLFVRWKVPLVEYHKNNIRSYLIRWRSVLSNKETDRRGAWQVDDDDEELSLGKAEKDGNRWLEMIQGVAEGGSVIIGGLRPRTTYEVSVAAGTREGYGPRSEPERAQTDGDGWCCLVVLWLRMHVGTLLLINK